MLRVIVVSSAVYSPIVFFFYCYGDHRDLHSFPTRRSSDLPGPLTRAGCEHMKGPKVVKPCFHLARLRGNFWRIRRERDSIPCCRDRKSTRLNSSHMSISYAVFCLKKKKT